MPTNTETRTGLLAAVGDVSPSSLKYNGKKPHSV
jgi:hypothetical protein